MLLFAFLLGVLAAVGFYLGLSGYIIVGIALFLIALQWYFGPSLIWATTNMREISRKELPWLFEMVEKICKKTKTPMPRKIALVNSGSPNAFVFGRTPSSATLAVTQGLLNTLKREEIEAVIAHEMGHINHKDMVIMTTVAAIPTIAYFVARFLIFAPSDRDRSAGAAILGLGAFLVYFITNLLVLAFSRLREYYADRFSALNTRPSHLASALAKITYGLSMSKEVENQAVRSFYICDPLLAAREVSQFSEEYSDLKLEREELRKAMEWERRSLFAKISEIFRTHPLTYKRILALRELEGKIY